MTVKVLKAFWHRGRKAFVLWTLPELVRRIEQDEELVLMTLRGLRSAGLAQTVSVGKGPYFQSAWALTPKGQEAARVAMKEAA